MTITTLESVRCALCDTPVELRRQHAEGDANYAALWCPRCREFVEVGETNAEGAVAVVFE